MKISLVIPAYNEAPVILRTLEALRDTFESRFTNNEIAWEILVVDNGSTDDTGVEARKINDERVLVLALTEKGKGHAVRFGFSRATGDVIGFTDADLSVSPQEVARAFLRVLDVNGPPILVGSRAHLESRLPGRAWWRSGSSWLFNGVVRGVIGVQARDTQCPLKVMRTKESLLLRVTKDPTWFFDIEFFALLEGLGVPFVEIPVTWNEHQYPDRVSKLSMVRDGVRGCFHILKIRSGLARQLAELRKTFSMDQYMKWIIVGLGNPGGEYAHTRHNAGRIVLEELRVVAGGSEWEYKKTYDALVSHGTLAGNDVLLLEPETFMNASGKSLATLVKNPAQAQQLVVIHDDVDLPIGSWRFASLGRGSGGQKGVESIMSVLKTRDFIRLRIGIGSREQGTGPRTRASDIVLQKMRPEELALIQEIGKSKELRESIESLLVNGLEYSRSQWKKWKLDRGIEHAEKKTTT